MNTTPNTPAKYWLVTWTTYGTWLPGDPRGFRTWRGKVYVPPPARYGDSGESVYDPSRYAESYQVAVDAVERPVLLSTSQRRVVLDALLDDLGTIGITPGILAVDDRHVHLLAQFGKYVIRPTVGRLKSVVTCRLREEGFCGKRVWSKGCHMRSLADGKGYRAAFEYVRKHQDNGAVIHIWQMNTD